MRTPILLLLFFAVSISAQNVKSKIDSLLNNKFFESTQIAVKVIDPENSDTLYQKNHKLLLRPASNMKIFTSAAGLNFLGEEYNFETSVFGTGKTQDSVLTGDLYVRGGCDPDFTLDNLDSLVEMIYSKGIRKIDGRVYGDISMTDSIYWGKGWMWDDEPSTNFPYLTPLVFNDNAVKVIFEPNQVHNPLKVEYLPKSKYLDIKNTSYTTVKDTSDLEITRDWINKSNKLIVKGYHPYIAAKDTVEMTVVHPEKIFIEQFLYKLRKLDLTEQEFELYQDTPDSSMKICSFERPYEEVIVNLNKKSDNLSAEMTLRALAYLNGGEYASVDEGIKLIDSLLVLSGYNGPDYRMVDGSGVSHYNLVNNEMIVSILNYFYSEKPELYQTLKESFPLSGEDGTLYYRMKEGSAYKNVFAKTGTLSGVSSLSGYLHTESDKTLVFSIMVQNYVGSSRTARGFQDKICEILCKYY